MDPDGGGNTWEEGCAQPVEEEVGTCQEREAIREDEPRKKNESLGPSLQFRRVGSLMGDDDCLGS